jgi:hypothetical protein
MGPLARFMGLVFAATLIVVGTFGAGGLLVLAYWQFALRGYGARDAAIQRKLRSLLMPDEDVIAQALQRKLCAPFARRKLVAITNRRMLVIARGLPGGFRMQGFPWRELRDVQLWENVLPAVFGATVRLTVSPKGGEALEVELEGAACDEAAKLYAQAKAQEHAWNEKRRLRDLDEKRAVSGGMILSGGFPLSQGGSLDELERAKKLFDQGAVDEAEYRQLKTKILSRAS